MTTTHTRRPTEPTCPPWCAGHEGNFQDWETLTDGTGMNRDHGEDVVTQVAGGYAIEIVQSEHSVNGMGEPRVALYSPDLNPDQDHTEAEAHELGMALVRAADRLRRFRAEAGR